MRDEWDETNAPGGDLPILEIPIADEKDGVGVRLDETAGSAGCASELVYRRREGERERHFADQPP